MLCNATITRESWVLREYRFFVPVVQILKTYFHFCISSATLGHLKASLSLMTKYRCVACINPMCICEVMSIFQGVCLLKNFRTLDRFDRPQSLLSLRFILLSSDRQIKALSSYSNVKTQSVPTSLASTAYTFRAPALAAKNARIPLPVPTSSTTLPCVQVRRWRRGGGVGVNPSTVEGTACMRPCVTHTFCSLEERQV